MAVVLIHGSWHTGAVWHKVQGALADRHIPVFAPTLSGFTPLAYAAGREVGLACNIHDVVDLLATHNLWDVVLVGHSYSGLVISGVADKMAERLAALVYLDAFIAEDGQSLFDIIGPESAAYYRGVAVNAAGEGRTEGVMDGWLLPPGTPQDYGVTVPADVEWLAARMVYSPLLTFEEPLRLDNPPPPLPRYFIRCTAFPYLAAQAQKAVALGWPLLPLATGHDAMLTEPVALTALVARIWEETRSERA